MNQTEQRIKACVKGKANQTTLSQLRIDWGGCERCGHGAAAHNKTYMRGVFPCDVLFVGEAPGKTEDLMGYPFLGKSGRLLDLWVQLVEDVNPTVEVGMMNLLACRPCDRPGGSNVTPTWEHVHNCMARTLTLLVMAQPQKIFLLGLAVQKLFRKMLPQIKEANLVDIPHPAAAVRQGGVASGYHAKATSILMTAVHHLKGKRNAKKKATKAS